MISLNFYEEYQISILLIDYGLIISIDLRKKAFFYCFLYYHSISCFPDLPHCRSQSIILQPSIKKIQIKFIQLKQDLSFQKHPKIQKSQQQNYYASISLMTQKQNQNKNKGKIICDVQLGKKIGIGTFATVKEGIHLKTKQKVAVKILHKRLIVDTHDKINISRQMRIVRNLRHPNIIKVLQIAETNKKIYIIMQKAQGGELYQEIINSRKNYLEQQIASRYFQQLLNTIQYLHTLGVTHRDIKPQNILIDKNNSIKLIDFGLSNYFQDKTSLTTACGSPCYAAPEMLNKKSYDPHKTDLWSCGIVLYTMLVGYLPFQHQRTSQILKLIQIGIYDEPNHLSLQAKHLLHRMLQIDPQKRLTITEIRNHTFCTKYTQKIVKGLFPNDKINLDSQIIQQMKSLGLSGFIKDIEGNNLNQNTAIYYLLFIKKLSKNNISLLQYYENTLQKRNIFRSRSIIGRQSSSKNPQEELPSIIKNTNIISLKNLNEIQSQIFLIKLKQQSKKVRGYSSSKLIKVRR